MSKYTDTVISTRVRLARNINGLPFPNRLNGQEEIYTRLYAGVQKACDGLFKSNFYRISDLAGREAQALVEQHLISPDLLNSPYGAVLIDEDKDISVMLNEEDHIREQCIMRGFDFENAYNRIRKVDAAIAERLDIAFDQKFGYLTACPTNLGAGLRVSAMMFLPALTLRGSMNALIIKYQDNGITTRGIYGEGSEAAGYMYQISNQAVIGLSEEEIIGRMNGVVTKLAEAEQIARKMLSDENGIELKDAIMRAYGTLRYACKLTSQEFLKELASVKLGVSLGYLDLDTEKLNSLIVMTQPAMLCSLAKKELNAADRDIMRGVLVNKAMEPIK